MRFLSVFSWLRKKDNKRRYRTHRPRLGVEVLEGRIVPVVGNQFALPPLLPAAPGTPNAVYNGVVQIQDTAWPYGIGSGELLSDGLHALTAGHVLAGDTGSLTANAKTITFQLARTDGSGGAANPIFRNININNSGDTILNS